MVLSASPTFTGTVAVAAVTATSLALGGATLGTNALAVTGTTQLNSALNYGGITLSNAVTGTGNMVLSASPTLTGTVTGASCTWSGNAYIGGTSDQGYGPGAQKLQVNSSAVLYGASATPRTFWFGEAGVNTGARTIGSIGYATGVTSGSVLDFIVTSGADTAAAAKFNYNLGIGMTPVNVLDITQNQNGGSYAKILNSNAGAGADSGFVGGNGTSTITVASYGTAASTFGALTAGMGYIYANAASGLAILSAGVLKFTANGSAEVARFDTSGNLQVGGTTGSGQISITKASLPTFSILKTGIVEVVHTIDAANNYTFGNGASGFQMNMGGGPYIAPGTDNVMTLGTSSFRWTTVYATTGTINTSDATTKQWLGDFNATEMAVASDIFAEIGSYKFLDAMEEKGDKARIHVGVRAQNVEQAFTKQGLTGFDYGLLCFDKWEDDVTEGAKAGQRYGIRNDELHYFLIAALEKRLKASEAAVAELTTRLSALESK